MRSGASARSFSRSLQPSIAAGVGGDVVEPVQETVALNHKVGYPVLYRTAGVITLEFYEDLNLGKRIYSL